MNVVFIKQFDKDIGKITDHNRKRFLLAVSGGIDSMVMAELFRHSKQNITIAHCNFRLRGKESNEDEKFVWRYARTHKIPFHVKHFDTKEYAVKHKLSVQMAARELRYNWLNELCKKYKYNYAAVAHNSDDAIETFFINLLRGTGITGLHGITSSLPLSHSTLIRPLLGFSRAEIEHYARKNKIKWMEDSSNATDKYMRNKIRHRLIPLLEKIQPNARKTIGLTMENLRETEAIYRNAINEKISGFLHKKNDRIFISIRELKALENTTLYLFEAIRQYNFNYTQAKEIAGCLNGQSGKTFLSATHRLTIDREDIIIGVRDKPARADSDGEYGVRGKEYKIKKTDKRIATESFTMNFSSKEKKDIPKLSTFSRNSAGQHSKSIAFLDYGKLKFPLTLRKWKNGDKFYPLGMNSPKKVSDFLIDLKIPRPDKEQVYALVSGSDIVWLVGHRIDNRFKITPATKKMYICGIVDNSQ